MKNVIDRSLEAVYIYIYTDSLNEIKNNMKEYKNKNKSYLSIRNNGGITLIALVITIVILIILAGISIMGVTKKGIFSKAKLAKEEYEKEQNNESKILSIYDNKVNEYTSLNNNRENKNNKSKILWQGKATSGKINLLDSVYNYNFLLITAREIGEATAIVKIEENDNILRGGTNLTTINNSGALYWGFYFDNILNDGKTLNLIGSKYGFSNNSWNGDVEITSIVGLNIGI